MKKSLAGDPHLKMSMQKSKGRPGVEHRDKGEKAIQNLSCKELFSNPNDVCGSGASDTVSLEEQNLCSYVKRAIRTSKIEVWGSAGGLDVGSEVSGEVQKL
jgi:hypothetical protein